MKMKKEHIYMGLGALALFAMSSKRKDNGSKSADDASLRASAESKQQGGTASPEGQAAPKGKRQPSDKGRSGISANEVRARKASIKVLNEKIKTSATLISAVTAAIAAYRAIQPELAASQETNQDFAAILGELAQLPMVPMDVTTKDLEDRTKRAESKYQSELKKLQDINSDISKLSESPDGESKFDALKEKKKIQVSAVKSATFEFTSCENDRDRRYNVDRLIRRLIELAK